MKIIIVFPNQVLLWTMVICKNFINFLKGIRLVDSKTSLNVEQNKKFHIVLFYIVMHPMWARMHLSMIWKQGEIGTTENKKFL